MEKSIIKLSKSAVLALILGFMQAGPVQAASSMLKQNWKPVVALGTAGLSAYYAEKIKSDSYASAYAGWKDLNHGLSDHIRSTLLVKIPKGVASGSELVNSLFFKEIPKEWDSVFGEENAGAVGGTFGAPQGMVISSDFAPSDFVLLHEIGHLYHGDISERLRDNLLAHVAIGYGQVRYLLNSSSKLNFMKRVGVACLWSGLINYFLVKLALNKRILISEERADDFAIDSLKKHNDVEALLKGRKYFSNIRAAHDKVVLINLGQIGISKDMLDRVGARSKFVASILDLWANDHPAPDSRIAKIDRAIAELKTREIKE